MIAELKLGHVWQLEAAATLSQIGCLSVGWGTLDKYFTGQELMGAEAAEIRNQAQIGCRLLEGVPRLKMVAEIVGRQNETHRRGATLSPDQQAIAMGAQMVRAAADFDLLERRGLSSEHALARMKSAADPYDPVVLSALTNVVFQRRTPVSPVYV
jgi:response regulator RpfG family c-di-GMP phosphodiesterase